MNEILLYFVLYPYYAEEIVEKIIEAGDSAYTIRMGTDGGDIDAGRNVVSRMQESKGVKTCIIDSKAFSMGAFMLPFFDVVKAYSHARIMLHKAAYEAYHEPSDEDLRQLKVINDQFKAQLIKRGVNQDIIDRVFEADVRNDVYLSAQEAMDAGLVDEVLELDIVGRKKLDARMMTTIAACASKFKDIYPESNDDGGGNSININSKKMTLEELQVKHPGLLAQVIAMGVAQELKRVKAWATHLKGEDGTANALAIAGISAGTDYDISVMAEMNKIMLAEGMAAKVTAENPDGSVVIADVVTEAVTAVIAAGGDAAAINAAAIAAIGTVDLNPAAVPAADAGAADIAARGDASIKASFDTVLGLVTRKPVV